MHPVTPTGWAIETGNEGFHQGAVWALCECETCSNSFDYELRPNKELKELEGLVSVVLRLIQRRGVASAFRVSRPGLY